MISAPIKSISDIQIGEFYQDKYSLNKTSGLSDKGDISTTILIKPNLIAAFRRKPTKKTVHFSQVVDIVQIEEKQLTYAVRSVKRAQSTCCLIF
jgi:hypothetical protein